MNVELKEELDNLDLENILLISIIDREPTEEEKEDSYSLTISEKLYFENKDLIDAFVRKMCSYKRQWIKVLYFDSKYHMTEEYFNLLKNNTSLEHIMLNDYEFTKKDFDILKQNESLQEIETTILSPELSECYDIRLSQVMKREVSGFLSIKELIYEKGLRIHGPLSDEETQEICRLLEKRQVTGNIEFLDFTDSKPIKIIIDKIKELETTKEEKTELSIFIKDRYNFSYESFTDKKQNSTIKVFTETDEETNMNDYIKVENEIKKILEPIEKHKDNLSPFEALIWLHTIVATFREYKKEGTNEDYRISRFLNKLLFSDKMVCVGYSYLLSDCAKRFNLDVWENFACSKSDNRKDDEYNHLNNLAFVKDEKYDINGVYLLDVTFDNHKDKELYVLNHFLLTPEKYHQHIQEMYAAGYSLLVIKDKDEFLRIIKSDERALSSLITIIYNYFKNDELFKVECSNSEDLNLYYMSSVDSLYDLAQNINIEAISEDKIKRALVHIEKLKNPQIGIEELEERLDKTLELYRERNIKIFKEEKVIQKK